MSSRPAPTMPHPTRTEQPIRILGAVGSPYSRKLRAALRYRRIPYAWINQGSPEAAALPRPKVELLPQLFLADEQGQVAARTDSTPLLRELESLVPSDRQIVPPDPVLALLDGLIEDYADEWLTKAMFHYRWAHAEDVAKAAAILPRWFDPGGDDENLARAGRSFSRRQIERLAVVGSNETTAPTLEAGYRRLLERLDAHLRGRRFLLGDRPGTGDFAVYGQLTQLALFDPTPVAIALEIAPRVVAWTDLVEDLSGLEPRPTDWLPRDALPDTLRALLEEIGRTHAPFLLANAAALEAGREQVECEIDGRPWRQRPFPYQAKCLAWLRRDRDALAQADRSAFDALVAGTGCEAIFA